LDRTNNIEVKHRRINKTRDTNFRFGHPIDVAFSAEETLLTLEVVDTEREEPRSKVVFFHVRLTPTIIKQATSNGTFQVKPTFIRSMNLIYTPLTTNKNKKKKKTIPSHTDRKGTKKSISHLDW
jgi:hypothetical protein